MDLLPIEIQRVILNQLDASTIISYMTASRSTLNAVKSIVRLWENLPHVTDYLDRNDLVCFILTNKRENIVSLIPRAVANGKVLCLKSIHKKHPEIDMTHYYQRVMIHRLADLLSLIDIVPDLSKERLAKLALRGRSREAIRFIAKNYGITKEVVIAAYMFADEELIKLARTSYCVSCRYVLALYGTIWSNNKSLFDQHFSNRPVSIECSEEPHTLSLGESTTIKCYGIGEGFLFYIINDAVALDRIWAIQRLYERFVKLHGFPLDLATIMKAIEYNSYKVLDYAVTSYSKNNRVTITCPSDVLDKRIYETIKRSPSFILKAMNSSYSYYKRTERLYRRAIFRFDTAMRVLGEDVFDHCEELFDITKDLEAVVATINKEHPTKPSDLRSSFISTFKKQFETYRGICYAIVNRKLIAAKYLLAAHRYPTCLTEDIIKDGEYIITYDGIPHFGGLQRINVKEEESLSLIALLTIAIERSDIPVIRLLLPYASRAMRLPRLTKLREEVIPLIKTAKIKVRFTSLVDPYLLPPSLFDVDIISNVGLTQLIVAVIKMNHKTALAKLEKLYPEAVREARESYLFQVWGNDAKPLSVEWNARVVGYYNEV